MLWFFPRKRIGAENVSSTYEIGFPQGAYFFDFVENFHIELDIPPLMMMFVVKIRHFRR